MKKIKGYKEKDGHSQFAYTAVERSRLEREIKRDLCWEPAFARWVLRRDTFKCWGALRSQAFVCHSIFEGDQLDEDLVSPYISMMDTKEIAKYKKKLREETITVCGDFGSTSYLKKK